jgi:hypothetical protein
MYGAVNMKITFGLFLILVFSFTVSGQIVSPDNNCEENLSLLERVRTPIEKSNPLIFIAYRSKKENSIKYSLRRLHRIKTLLGDKNIVFAIGEKLVTKPRVEVYVDGKLDVVFETNNREPLRAGACGN